MKGVEFACSLNRRMQSGAGYETQTHDSWGGNWHSYA
jgi:hypothetical protein